VKRKVNSTASQNTDTAVGLSNGNGLADIPPSFSYDPAAQSPDGTHGYVEVIPRTHEFRHELVGNCTNHHHVTLQF